MNLEKIFARGMSENLAVTRAERTEKLLQAHIPLPIGESQLLQNYKDALMQKPPDPRLTRTLRRNLIERFGKEGWRNIYDSWLSNSQPLTQESGHFTSL